jgi:murein L,D-transpeptidase YcbB/YkuD
MKCSKPKGSPLYQPSIKRRRAYLFGLAAVPSLWAAAVAATIPFSIPLATLPQPQHWTRPAANQLLNYIDHVGSHGLEPANYEPDELKSAIQSGDPAQLERQASESFGFVARDLANGRVPAVQRRRFYIATAPLQASQVAILIDRGLTDGDVGKVLEGVAPTDPQYAALRAALAALPAGSQAERRKLLVSLERWRWLPRELGATHLRVNIPEYRARLMQDGKEIASHRVIVGKPSTPTPQFSAAVTGVIVNPTWQVPQSIIAESIGHLVRATPQAARARGFSWSSSSGRLSVVQGPGDGNALGRVKLEMPNPFTVYLHDTPNKELFDKPDRAFSHGCIRTDKPLDLAATLLGPAGWTRAKIDEAVATGRTQRVALQRPIPVYVLYFTVYADADGTVRYLNDPYGLDAAIYASLTRR